MSTPSFFNQNENRAYPFTDSDTNPLDSVVVDVGFVAGPRSRYESGVHAVRLVSLRRQGAFFYLDFTSDAPELFGVPLTFSRHISSGDFAVEFIDSGTAGISASSDSGFSDSESLAHRACDEPLWWGFLVTGRMSTLEELLPSDGALSFSATVEPALIQNLAEAYVTQLATANIDRTRVTASEECEGEAEESNSTVYTNATCVIGDVVLVAGYNSTITQSDQDNSITLGAVVGAGAGEPCEQVERYPGEQPPDGSSLLEGGPRCNQVLRSVNGIAGPLLSLIAGRGVTITSVPEENTVIVNVNMTGLALCFDSISAVSESC